MYEWLVNPGLGRDGNVEIFERSSRVEKRGSCLKNIDNLSGIDRESQSSRSPVPAVPWKGSCTSND